jgi:2-polyprenyl-3-methyl-5-hydroxy-6-metoxy-1,4-benzoquinol methylase
MTLPKDIRQHFNRRAAHYDNRVTAFIGERELRLIRKLIPPGSVVLDYGCGTGRTTIDLLQRGCHVTAFDISQEMIRLAEVRAGQVGFSAEFTTDSDKLSDRIWPLVTCIGVLDYYAYPQPLLELLGSYLAPGGRLIVTYPNALSPLGWAYALGSRFRFPVIPHTPRYARQVALRSGLRSVSLGFAFPAIPFLGHTLVVEMVELLHLG